MKSCLEKDLILLVNQMESWIHRARVAGDCEPLNSRVAGFFSGKASGIEFVLSSLKSILEDYDEN